MSNWRTVPLGELVSIVGGGTPSRSTSDFYGGSIPWVTPKDMKSWNIHGAQINLTQAGLDNSAARLVPANSILVVVRSGILKHTLPVAVNRLPVTINQDMKALLCGNGLEADFLAHFVKAQSSVILQWVRATTADNFPIDKLKRLPVPVPPPAEQRRIAEVLDRAEELRAKRRAALTQLDTLTQAIFLDMFGDPATNPKGWPKTLLGDVVAEMKYGPRFYNEAYAEDGIRIVRITDLTDAGRLDFQSMPRMRVSDEDEAQFRLRPGDVIFARSGATVGKAAVFTATDPPCIPGAYFIRLRFQDAVSPEYALAVLTTPSVRAIVESRSRQAAQQNFSGPALRRLPMPAPPLALQRQFVEQKTAVDRQRAIQQAALAELDALFASLQHRAFRGEL